MALLNTVIAVIEEDDEINKTPRPGESFQGQPTVADQRDFVFI